MKIWQLVEAGANPPRGRNDHDHDTGDGRRRRVKMNRRNPDGTIYQILVEAKFVPPSADFTVW